MRIAVPDLISPSYFPAIAAVDLGLAREEGLLAGHSSGAALWAIERLARQGVHGTVVTVFPDGGDRYLAAGLYQVKR